MDSRSQLHSLTNRILNAEKKASGELFATTNELFTFLLQITGTDADEDKHREKIHLESGHAIGLTWAAMCINDILRTKKFMDGIYEAVVHTIRKQGKRPIHILYAGTGPFATLVLPLVSRFSSTQLRFTLLEVNESSFHCLKRLIDVLQLRSYIYHTEKADATTWQNDPEFPPDIFISETMNTGLGKEPQVAIFFNIVPQLNDEVIIIPETITLQAALIDPVKRMKYKLNNEETSDSIYLSGNIFDLNRSTILQHAIDFRRSGGVYKFPEVAVSIPTAKATTHSQFCVLTHITVYDTIELLIDESPLTVPLKLIEFSDVIPARIKCYYETGENPGVRFII
jgi:hypothetical protein